MSPGDGDEGQASRFGEFRRVLDAQCVIPSLSDSIFRGT